MGLVSIISGSGFTSAAGFRAFTFMAYDFRNAPFSFLIEVEVMPHRGFAIIGLEDP